MCVNDHFCAPDSMNEAADHLSGQVEQVTGGMCASSQTSLYSNIDCGNCTLKLD